MRRFDKNENIRKANLLVEQRYLQSKGFGESLNEFEFDMPRKPVTNDDMGKWEDRERMKHRIDGKFNGLNVSNSEDHNRRGELGDGNLVIQTNGNLSPEVESEIANLAYSNDWGFESFLDGLYLLFQGDFYGDRFQGIDENEILDEGLKQWIAGGLIALTTLGGVGKIYQLNQEKAANQQIEMKYYNDVLSDTVSKMSKEDLSSIGTDINEKTRDIAMAREFSGEELTSIFSNYASKYIQGHAKEFGINANGGIQWLGTK